jgi:peptidoglycan/xylan/chitin deacetylase (PgdA/CDA1 family)
MISDITRKAQSGRGPVLVESEQCLSHLGPHDYSWPGGRKVAVCLTFDLDAEAGFIGDGPQYLRRLSSLSEGRYGVRRGLPRILDLLDRHGIPATFFVPGRTAVEHRDAVGAILAGGHEIGHHGHEHVRSDLVSEAVQRAEIERGLEALEAAGAPRPRGYRSSSWELTPETFDLLIEHDFEYDSSCMGDDRPYLETWGGRQIVELPVHWSLDDWPHFGWSIDHGGNLAPPAQLLANWCAELEAARNEERSIIFTMHPEVIGRSYRFEQILPKLIEDILETGDAWFAHMDDLCNHVRPGLVGAVA